MKVQTIIYRSPIDALSTIVRTLSSYEHQYQMSSEEFYARYQAGKLQDSADFVEWAGDYQHYFELKLRTYPDHKHTTIAVVASVHPTIEQVLREIQVILE